MKESKKNTRAIAPSLLFISLAYTYIKTIAPGLTWANSGADGGDLITAAATGGIAHPSGYPLYLILARAFQALPIDSLAYRTNLMSAFFALLTALLVYIILFKYLLTELDEYIASIAALSAGYTIGLSPLFWSQALITEVYTLHTFFIALIIYLALFPFKKNWTGIVSGLALGNHLTTILLIPAIFGLFFFDKNLIKQERKKWQPFLAQILYLFSGLSIYLLLPWRAAKNPFINWGNPITLENFWWLISGKIYRAHYLQDTFTSLWTRVEASASLFLEQFGIIGITLGFLGLVFFYKKSKLYLLTIWISITFWATSLIYQTSDSYLYIIPVILSFSIWLGIAVGFSLQILKKHNNLLPWLFLCLLSLNFIIGTTKNWRKVDASQDQRAENFAHEVFTQAPDNAIVFAKGDQAVFSLWYFHFALKERTDLKILATDLLHYDWYQNSMRKAYPTLALPGPFPWDTTVIAANPSHAICHVHQTQIDCE